MKKTIAFVISALMLFSLLPSAAFAKTTTPVFKTYVDIDTVDLGYNDTFDVFVYLTDISEEGSLCYADFFFNYDNTRLKLINAVNSDYSLDCIDSVPDESWENLSVIKSEPGDADKDGFIASTERVPVNTGSIHCTVLTTEEDIPRTESGTIGFVFRFEIIEKAHTELEFSVPSNTAAGAIAENPVSLISAEGTTVLAQMHNYEQTVIEPDCNNGGCTFNKCTDCEDGFYNNYTEPLGHKAGANATCTEDQTCTVCGTLIAEKTGHSYIDHIIDPTCTQNGYILHICDACGDEYTDGEIVMLGHSYTDTVIEPTCTEKGYTIHKCDACGDEYTDSETDAVGHKEGEWETVTEPSYGIEGLEQLKCLVCGEVIDERVIPALAYQKGDVNGNGSVDAQDYALAKRHCLKTYTLTEEMVMRADLNGNGTLEASEYAMIKRHVLGTFVIK
ncbi:MAG: dockerin type I repeat-containing protein [Clostridia bacterium]|nr:dockerin type I repeat-containing protein [Clostridia bacterium]